MRVELLMRRGHLAPRLLERRGDLPAGLLARLHRRELQLGSPRVRLLALLLGDTLELGDPGGEPRLGLRQPALERLARLRARGLELGHARLRLLGRRPQLGHLRLRLVAHQPERQLDLARPALRDLQLGLGGLRPRLGPLTCPVRLELELGDPRVGLLGHRHERALDLARPAPRALELLAQLAGRRAELTLQPLALRARGLELLGGLTAHLLDLLTGQRELLRLLGRRLLGRGHPRGGVLPRPHGQLLDLRDALLALLPRGLQRALGVARTRAQCVQLGGGRGCRAAGLVSRPLGVRQAPAQVGGGPVGVRARPRQPLLQRRRQRDLPGARRRLLVQALGKRRRLRALTIAFGA